MNHDAEVRVAVSLTSSTTGKPKTVWQAYCACGWVGPSRGDLSAADDDAYAHRIATNPEGRR